MNLPSKPSRVNLEAIDIRQIEHILKTGALDSLTPAERQYFDLMEMVRGLRARMLLPGGTRIVTKAGIIKLLKSEAYGLSDWMARQVYADALNFFYRDDGVTPRAWSNFYAEKMEKLADLSINMGKLKEARGYFMDAARLRGCFDEAVPEIPRELLDANPTVIYATDPESMGAPKANRTELEKFIDEIPDVPVQLRERVKEDASIKKRDLFKRVIEDVKEYGEEDN
ncbi:MAG: hypothetical protein J6C44_10050 [Muribaculaceae bacterium]|nr:hypothetical protein [Muribaculaceae bacterium]